MLAEPGPLAAVRLSWVRVVVAAAQVHCWTDNHWLLALRGNYGNCLHRNRGHTRCEHVVAGIRHDGPSALLSVSTQFPDISALSRCCSHPFYPVVLSWGRCGGNRSKCTAMIGGRLFGPGRLSPSRDSAQLSQEDEGTLARPCLPTLGRSPQGWQSRFRLRGGCPVLLGAGPWRLTVWVTCHGYSPRVTDGVSKWIIMRRCFTIGPTKEGPQSLVGLMASGLWMSLQAGLRGGQGEATREPLVGARMPRASQRAQPGPEPKPSQAWVPGVGSSGRALGPVLLWFLSSGSAR